MWNVPTGRGVRRRRSDSKTSVAKLTSQRRWRAEHPERYMWSQLKGRARRRGIPFDLTPEDLLPLPAHCPVLGLPLLYFGESVREGIDQPRTASVDRRDNTKGYTKDNVIVVSLRANTLKADARPEELRALAAFYASEEG